MRPITIGVAGGTGSGKTTVALKILERVGFRSRRVRAARRLLSRRQRPAADRSAPSSTSTIRTRWITSLMIEHLKRLQAGQATEVPVYDFKTHSRLAETRHVDPQPVIMVEGILIFADKRLRDLMDMKIFVDTDADLRLIRRLQRDIEERERSPMSVINQYLRTVRPMHLEFVEPSKRYADVIIPEGGFNEVAIDMVATRLRVLADDRQ